MRLLLDTHILLWWMADDQRLPGVVAEAIAQPNAEVSVSAITFAEIAIKTSLGKLTVNGNLRNAAEQSGFLFLPFSVDHAQRLTDLAWHHRDPFDRMLIAQAMVEGLVFVSMDKVCREYAVQLLR
jgi:PIN domain nuclease of toxin-antitoxin system